MSFQLIIIQHIEDLIDEKQYIAVCEKIRYSFLDVKAISVTRKVNESCMHKDIPSPEIKDIPE